MFLEGCFDSKTYILNNNNEIINKPESSIILVNSEATASTGTIILSNMPNPTKVHITGNGDTFNRKIIDGSYEFSLDVAGDYIIKCEPDIKQPIEFQVRIT